jgi:hypothetical protein
MTYSQTLPDGAIVSLECNSGGHILSVKRGKVVSAFSMTPEESQAMARLMALQHGFVKAECSVAQLAPLFPKGRCGCKAQGTGFDPSQCSTHGVRSA